MPTLGEFPFGFLIAVGVALGLVFGSFLNVVIHRLPRGESLVRPGSSCPSCGTSIAAYDNLPVLGWLLLRGRSRCCKTKISPRYPLVELLGGLSAWAILEVVVVPLDPETPFLRVGLLFVVHLALALGLIAAAFIDLDHMYLPDEITLGGAALGLLSVPIRAEIDLGSALFGAALGFVLIWLPFDFLYAKIRGSPGMGLGDAKLTLLAGAWFGWPGAVFALFAGAVQATVAALIVYVVRGRIEEPEAVRQERAALEAAIEAASGDERAALEDERRLDPLGSEPEPGLGKARLAFGPFLALAVLEYMLIGDAGRAMFTSYLGVW